MKMPHVLLLDEPLSNLDARLRLQTREEIRRIQKETGITTVFVTHDQEEAMSISDRIVVMKSGVVSRWAGPRRSMTIPRACLWPNSWARPPSTSSKAKCRAESSVSVRTSRAGNPRRSRAAPCGWAFARRASCPGRGRPSDLRSSSRVEVMGRDISVVSTHPACANADASAPLSVRKTRWIPPQHRPCASALRPRTRCSSLHKETGSARGLTEKERSGRHESEQLEGLAVSSARPSSSWGSS